MPFQVIFEGLKDDTLEQRELVKSKLIEKFKLPPEKAERMMASAPIVVKKGLTQDQANKYKSALESIGAIATVRLVPDETDLPPEQSAIPIDQAPIPAKAIQPQPPLPPLPSPIVEQPAEIKISESKPLPPLFLEEKPAPAPKPNPLESDYPIFYAESASATESPESAKNPASTIDPYKTNAQTPQVNDLHPEAATIQQPASSSARTTNISGEWWQTVQVLNPPFDESAKSVTPISSGRISANEVGFSISHPMIERIPFGDVQIISACQIGTGANPKLYVDIFIASTPRPIRLDLDLMNFATFGLTRLDDPAERLASAVTALLDRNHFLTLDLATYKLLKDKTKVKIVASEREIEKYCGKLQIEVDKGLSPEVNSNIVSCQQANELLSSSDPWVSAPPPSFPFPGQAPPMFNSAMPGRPPQGGFPNAPGQIMPPDAYTTQPVRQPNTMPGISQNPTQMSPPVRSPQAPPQQAPPQPYPPPYSQQPPNSAYPPPPAPGFGPQSNPYVPPQNQPYSNRPYAPPQMAPGQNAPPYAPPMSGQSPALYQPPGFAAQGQFPVSSPMGQYNNPNISNEVNKASEEANTALILSIVGLICGCLSPLAIVGLIKAQNALKIFDQYGIQQNRNKAAWAKGVAIVALVFYAIILLSWFAK
jgi:hypothetical protein